MTNREPDLTEIMRHADVASLEYKLYHVGLEDTGFTKDEIEQRLRELSSPIKGYTLSQRQVISRFLREQLHKLTTTTPDTN